jgi:hypothetical protein
MHFDISSATSVAMRGLEESARASVREELDPFEPSQATSPADLTIVQDEAGPEPCDELQGDAGDGWTCCWQRDRLALCVPRGMLALPPRLAVAPAELRRQGAFPIWRAFADVVRPSLATAGVARGAATAHASAVALDGAGVLIAGWSESGKTEAALALMEQGAGFISDKWTVVGGDGSLATFPARVSVRDWVLPYLPRLRRSLSGRARAQLVLARPLGAAVQRAARAARGRLTGAVTHAGARAAALAQRIIMRPTEIAAAYGQRPGPTSQPCRAAFILCTAPGGTPTVRSADPAWMAARLAQSAAFERRALTALAQRAAVFDPGALEAIELAGRREYELLVAALGKVPTKRIDVPFPCDPRRVASLVTAEL